jgi:magnesium transporter
MLRTYWRHEGKLSWAHSGKPASTPVWIDMLNPTNEEVLSIEHQIGVVIPTRAEMEEIELSSRLYREDDAIFLTHTGLIGLDTDAPAKTPVTFILKDNSLVTVRYAEPKPFASYIARVQKTKFPEAATGEDVMLGLMEAMIDRTADALEQIANETDAASREIFRADDLRADRKTRNLGQMIKRVGHKAELLTLIQESLVSASRLVAYYGVVEDPSDDTKETRYLLKLIQRDASSLSEQSRGLSARLDFLLSATLGMINLEQNQIIKIFSVAAVVFLPPTLVASIYGMNFTHMPELDWLLGYPWAIALMVISAVLPFLYFKRKGWL